MGWPLSVLARLTSAVTRNSDEPSVRDLKSMVSELRNWEKTYSTWAKEHRERHAKLELIGDRDADGERRARDDDEESAAKCNVAIRSLTWAIEQIAEKQAGQK